MATVTSLEWRIAQAGKRNQMVSSRRRALRLARRTDSLSMFRPNMPNTAGSTVTESKAASPTAEMAP